MAKRGARGKYDQERVDKLCQYLEAGNYIEASCALVNISVETFYQWFNSKPDFSEAVAQARAKAEAASVMRIRKAGMGGAQEKKEVITQYDKDGNVKSVKEVTTLTPPNWQADAWFLERSYPDRWGRTRQEITGKDGEPFKVYLNVDVEKV